MSGAKGTDAVYCGSIKICDCQHSHIAKQIADEHNAISDLLQVCRDTATFLANVAVTAALYGDSTSHGRFKNREKLLSEAVGRAEKGGT